MQKLVSTVPSRHELVSVDDLQRVLREPLPGPIFIDPFWLCQMGGTALPFAGRTNTESMPRLELLFTSAFSLIVADGTEEVWATYVDSLTGKVWQAIDNVVGKLSLQVNRNASDTSGATEKGLRPDFLLVSDGAMLCKAEHKQHSANFEQAKSELISKMAVWNPVLHRGLPFLPCYAAAGAIVQFFAISPSHAGSGQCVLTETTPIVHINTGVGRLEVVQYAFNMYRAFVSLRQRMPRRMLTPFIKQRRPDGGFVIIMEHHVTKVCAPVADPDIYAHLTGANPIVNSVNVELQGLYAHNPGYVSLRISPICSPESPETLGELKECIRFVIAAICDLHSRGFVHRDLRWGNVMKHGAHAWMLIDFELAARPDVELPHNYRHSTEFPPWSRAGRPCTFAHDLWQIGRLVSTWKTATALSDVDAKSFATACTADGASAASLQAHPWLA